MFSPNENAPLSPHASQVQALVRMATVTRYNSGSNIQVSSGIPAYYLLVHLEEQPQSSIYSFLVLLPVVILATLYLCGTGKRPSQKLG